MQDGQAARQPVVCTDCVLTHGRRAAAAEPKIDGRGMVEAANGSELRWAAQ